MARPKRPPPPGTDRLPRLSARRLNRATLARQMLLARERIGVVEAVQRLMAIQAQEAASPYLALWNRVADFEPSDLDRAFADHTVIKASLMRSTLHAVDARDYPAFHAVLSATLRAARLNDRRFGATGLSPAQADDLVEHVVKFAATRRTNAEFDAYLDEQFGAVPDPGPWWALRAFAALVHAPTGGPWSFGPRPSYVAAPPAHRPEGLAPDAALPVLIRRYLEAFGPATLGDIAQFAKLARVTVRKGIASMANALEQFEGPDGTTLYDVPGGLRPDEEAPAPPRLMAMWDSVLLAYEDRSRVIPEGDRRLVIRTNGDVLSSVLVDGEVVGVWRPVEGGIEASAFRKVSRESWHGLEAEAHALVAFLADRDPTVYRRYGRWWASLPSAEVRILPG